MGAWWSPRQAASEPETHSSVRWISCPVWARSQTKAGVSKPVMIPTIAISIGDPAGIGPEVVVKALADPAVSRLARWLVVGARPVLSAAESLTGLNVLGSGPVKVLDVPLPAGEIVVPGRLSAVCGRAALEYVRQGTLLCLAGEASAIV